MYLLIEKLLRLSQMVENSEESWWQEREEVMYRTQTQQQALARNQGQRKLGGEWQRLPSVAFIYAPNQYSPMLEKV